MGANHANGFWYKKLTTHPQQNTGINPHNPQTHTMESTDTIETFEFRFLENPYDNSPTVGTITIPVIFKDLIEIKEKEYVDDNYCDSFYNDVHIDTERYVSQLIDKVITGELSPTQLKERYEEFNDACKFLLREPEGFVVRKGKRVIKNRGKDTDTVMLGVERDYSSVPKE